MDIKNYISSGIIEMYVMDICSPEEKAELEILCQLHPEIKQALTDFEKQLELNFQQNAIMPSAEVDASIIQTFYTTKQAPVIPITQSYTTTNWLKAIAAIAVVFLIVSAIANVLLYKKNAQQLATIEHQITQNNPVATTTTLPLSDYNVLKQPDITPIAMNGVAPYTQCRCTMFWDKTTGKAYIMIHHLLQSNKEVNYQLWAMVNGNPINVGIVDDSIRDHFIPMSNMPQNATSFAVTIEKVGGSKIPTLQKTILAGSI
jgi:anti-sigma-K factor RskA